MAVVQRAIRGRALRCGGGHGGDRIGHRRLVA
jgi:hypothetical protein